MSPGYVWGDPFFKKEGENKFSQNLEIERKRCMQVKTEMKRKVGKEPERGSKKET